MLVAFVGIRLFYVPKNLIRQLAAVPAGSPERPTVNLRVEARPLLPFQRPRVIVTSLQNVTIPQKITPLVESWSTEGAEEPTRRSFAPLRRLSQLAFACVSSVRSVFSALLGGEFIYLLIKGKGVFKMHPRGQFEDQGKGMFASPKAPFHSLFEL